MGWFNRVQQTAGGLKATVVEQYHSDPWADVPGPDGLALREIGLLQGVDVLHQVFDRVAQRLEKGRGGVALCRDGCGKCCEVNTPTGTAWEAQHAMSTMSARGSVTPEALARAREWLVTPHPEAPTMPRTRPVILKGQPDAEFTGAELLQVRGEQAALAALPCPFLDRETKACTVYDARPLACRAWGVTTIAGDFCERPKDVNELLHPGQFSWNSTDQQVIWDNTAFVHREAGKIDPVLATGAFWPTVLYAHWDPVGFQSLIERGEVAQAKIGWTAPGGSYPGSITQSQLDRITALREHGPAAPVLITPH